MENLTIQDVLMKKDMYNIALPFTESRQVNPFYKISISQLYFAVDGRNTQVFKVGSRSIGKGRWEDLYSLTKSSLNRLATEAGIQFSPGSGDVVRIDENTWKASAFGAIRLPDENIRTSNNFKVIDLVMEERKCRLAYEEKAKKGISDYKAAKAAAENYAGRWVETAQVNESGYPVKIYLIDERDRDKYIEKSLIDAMAQLRADAPQKAATGAILRVIRDLLGIKGVYTKDELKKPFAVARMSFSPDYNDPLVRQMMLQMAMQSVGNLFGNNIPVVNSISIPEHQEEEIGVPVDVGCIQDAPAPMGSVQDAPPSMGGTRDSRGSGGLREQDLYCDKCGDPIARKVWEYSRSKFERPLCYKCQKAVRDGQKGGWGR